METGTKNVSWIVVGIVLVGAFVGLVPSVTFRLPVAERKDQAKITKVKADFAALVAACRFFRLDYGRYPASLEELYEPGPPPGGGKKNRYLVQAPLDPWTGELYTLRFLPDGTPEFVSFGADLQPGGGDINEDIVVRP